MRDDASMSHTTLNASIVALAMCFPAATVLAGETKSKPALSEFDGIDADRDGRISAAEHAAAASKMFRAMDANRDGKVTAAEMEAAYEKVNGKKASGIDLGAAEKIKAVDRDGDGVLTAVEHAAASKAMFRKMDTDGDATLSRDEWTAGHAALMRQAQK